AARDRLRHSRRDRATRKLRPADAAAADACLPEVPGLADLTLADLWIALDQASRHAPLTVDHALRRVALPDLHSRLAAAGGPMSALWRFLGDLARD
ncbi:MAG: hypothetical protein FJZ01_25695, partial [Candidatus Sericytochromatia bacterium]|nr:hypothetical protein [Candidatus Tanganyikabacteria bacterium]